MFALDADANRINMIGAEDPEQLEPEERARYRWMVASFFWGMQGLHRQWALGVLPEEEWQAWNRVICLNITTPGMRWAWQSFGFYTPDFTAVVESCPDPRG